MNARYWHKWFAWYPVYYGVYPIYYCGSFVWLRTIERKRIATPGVDTGYWIYRLNTNEN